MQANMGIAGEFRCVVKRADGSTKIDTGYQKNLILNQGLDFFGGGNGYNMMNYCVIGSGNSQPNYTQNKLDATIIGVTGTSWSYKNDYNAATDGDLYKVNRVNKYSFSGLNNINVSELGLASTYSNATTYFLCTRALIKDSQGNPTTITVLNGEVLEIYYKLWMVSDVTDITGSLNVLDGIGGITAYNYKQRLASVGWNNSFASSIGSTIDILSSDYNNGKSSLFLYTDDLQNHLGQPSSANSLSSSNITTQKSSYVSGSYKIRLTINIPISSGNGALRRILFATSMGTFQIRFGRVSDDAPITKTNTQTLTVPVEVSWGRYEGAL